MTAPTLTLPAIYVAIALVACFVCCLLGVVLGMRRGE